MKHCYLSFSKQRENGTVDAWVTSPSGDYGDDCITGNNLFEELRFRAETEKNPLIISRTLQAMIEKGALTGIEIGFLQSLSEQLAS